MIYPSGKRVRVNRDSRGRLSGLDKVDASNNVLLGYMSQVGYNTAGQMTGLNLGNGVAESYGYSNDRLQLTSQTATKGAATLMSLTYNYAASAGASGIGTGAGNIGQLMAITGTINSQTRNQAFTYDNVGRLVTATGWGAWQRRFAYDRWGNRTGMWNATSGGSQLQSIALQMSGSAPTNRISNVNGVSYVYDSSGNVTNDGAYAYTYDAESRLVSVSVGGSGSYGYDSANRRVKKVSGGVTTHYVWEGDQVVAEYDGTSGALISEYVYAGSRMVAREQSSTIRYYHADRLSTRMITDGAGAVVGTEDHLPFGEDAGVVGENEKHRFTNYERDTESGTDYAVNRQYSNGTGRFMRPDPVAGEIGNPQSFNRYSYSLNDPANLVDPLGLRWLSVTRCYTTSWSYKDDKGNIISESETKCETEEVWVPDAVIAFLSLTPIGGQEGNLPTGVWSRGNLLDVLTTVLAPNLKYGIIDVLSKGDCANYTQKLINEAARITGNPIWSDYVPDLVDAINSQGGYVWDAEPIRGGGMVTPGFVRLSNAIGKGNAIVHLAPRVGPGWVVDVAQQGYIGAALHETIHLSGANRPYLDSELARAAVNLGVTKSQKRRFDSINPGADDAEDLYSAFWNDLLREHCPGLR
jgi:RHS repeat-associated protein